MARFAREQPSTFAIGVFRQIEVDLVKVYGRFCLETVGRRIFRALLDQAILNFLLTCLTEENDPMLQVGRELYELANQAEKNYLKEYA